MTVRETVWCVKVNFCLFVCLNLSVLRVVKDLVSMDIWGMTQTFGLV